VLCVLELRYLKPISLGMAICSTAAKTILRNSSHRLSREMRVISPVAASSYFWKNGV
jgi:hypothetical protein